MTVPNAFVTIKGSVATVSPTGSDDYLNIQESIDAVKGLNNPEVKLMPGVFYSSKQLVAEDYDGVISGSGRDKTELVAGTSGAPMELLVDGDALSYAPHGFPSLLVCHPKSEEMLGGTYTFDGTTTVVSSDATGVLPVAGDYIRLDDESANHFGFAFKVASVAGTAPSLTVTIENPDAAVIPTGTGATRSVYKPSLSARNVSLEIQDITLSSNDALVGRVGQIREEIRTNVHIHSLVRLMGAYLRMDFNPTVGASQLDVIRTDLEMKNVHLKAGDNNSYIGVLAETATNWFERGPSPAIFVGRTSGMKLGTANGPFWSSINNATDNPRSTAMMNGSVKITKCEFSEMLEGVRIVGWIEDRADNTPHVMHSGAEANPSFRIEQNLFRRVYKNTKNSASVASVTGCVNTHAIGGGSISFSRNDIVDCRTIGAITSDSPPVGWFTQPGYLMSPTETSIINNSADLTLNAGMENNYFWLSFAPGFEFLLYGFSDLLIFGQHEWAKPGVGVVGSQTSILGKVRVIGNDIDVSSDLPGIINAGPSPIDGLSGVLVWPIYPIWVRNGKGDIDVTHNRLAVSEPTISNPDVLPKPPAIAVGFAPEVGAGLGVTADFISNDLSDWSGALFGLSGFIDGNAEDCRVVMAGESPTIFLDLGTNTVFVGAGQEGTPPAGALRSASHVTASQED